jgi:hypothetical protein
MMKHIPSYSSYKESLNEAITQLAPGSDPKLEQAAYLIASFVSKKAKDKFSVYPWGINIDGTPAIMLIGNKGSMIYVVGKGAGRGPGIVGALLYYSSFDNRNPDFAISSDNFPIVALLNEFVKFINEPKYADEVETLSESLNEGRGKPLTPQEQKMVIKQLQSGKSAAQIARDLKISYGMILQLKKNPGVSAQLDEAPIKANEQTLEDKVKFLDETLTDIYDIARRLAAGAFNSLMISGRAGTGKTYSVTKALNDEGLIEDDDYIVVSGAVSTIMMYKKMFQYRTKTLVFDDCDAVFRDENGRNILKAALDTKAIRRISYLKKSGLVFDPKDFEMDPEGEFNAIENGLVPAYFDFAGRVIFISNLPKDKADPDGAIRSRSILIDVNPDDATLMERIKVLLPHLEPRDMAIKDKEEIYEFMKKANDVSMRTFIKAAGFKQAGLKNWERMASRYL